MCASLKANNCRYPPGSARETEETIINADPAANIVLVHCSFVDGSAWRPVYDLLTPDGYHVAVVQNPTLSLKGDAAATRRSSTRKTARWCSSANATGPSGGPHQTGRVRGRRAAVTVARVSSAQISTRTPDPLLLGRAALRARRPTGPAPSWTNRTALPAPDMQAPFPLPAEASIVRHDRLTALLHEYFSAA